MSHHEGQCGNEKLMCAREKTWEELNDSEKIERLGAIIRRFSFLLENNRDCVNNLMVHEHSGDKIVVPIDSIEPVRKDRDVLDHS